MYDPYNIYRGVYKEYIESIIESRPVNKYFKYSERHHIVPRCVGGNDEEENLIYLTYQEHFIAHKILFEENMDSEPLCYAYWRTCNSNYECTPEEYAEAKMKISDKLRDQIISEETRKKMSEAARRRANSPEYREVFSARMRNYKHTEESRAKISMSCKGRTFSEETKKKLSASKLGHPVSLETRRKIAIAASNISDETRAKIAASSRNRVISDETRKKMSESHKGNTNRKGKSFTEEQRLRISEGRKNIGPIDYHLTCISCGLEFISRGPRGKYCSSCKEVLFNAK